SADYIECHWLRSFIDAWNRCWLAADKSARAGFNSAGLSCSTAAGIKTSAGCRRPRRQPEWRRGGAERVLRPLRASWFRERRLEDCIGAAFGSPSGLMTAVGPGAPREGCALGKVGLPKQT